MKHLGETCAVTSRMVLLRSAMIVLDAETGLCHVFLRDDGFGAIICLMTDCLSGRWRAACARTRRTSRI